MAIGVSVGAVNYNNVSELYAADGTEHAISPFTGQGTGVLLNNGAVPDTISVSDPGYPIKQIILAGTHSKSTSITANVSIGGSDFGSGTIGGASTWSRTIGDGSTSASGDVSISFTSNLSGTKQGTITISTLTFIEGAVSTKENTTITLTADGGKTTLDLNETVQLSSIVKDSESNVIGGAAVSYTSSDNTVATVSASGLVTASSSKYGSATITATYNGDDDYNGSTANITIKVKNPDISTFNIADIADANSWKSGTAYSELGTIDSVTITGSGTGNNRKYYDSDESWRFYNSGNGAFTVSTSVGYLKKVTLTGTSYFTSAPANWSYSDKVFTATNKTQTSATFSNGSGTSQITEIEVLIGHAHTVTYNANGGSGTMTDSNSPYDKGSTVTTLTNTFVAPSGYVFDHWNTKDDNTGTSYNPGATFTINANTTLYAQWADAGDDPYVDGITNTITGVYTGQHLEISFNYGNFTNKPTLTSSNPSVFTVSNVDVEDENDSSATLNLLTADSANLLFKDGSTTVKTVAIIVTQTTLSLNKNSTSIRQGESETLTATTNVGGANWSSNNAKVTVVGGVVTIAADATVNSTATITATSTVDANVSATCTVTVTEHPFEDCITNAKTSGIRGANTTSWGSDGTITDYTGASYFVHSMGVDSNTSSVRWNKNGYLYSTVVPSRAKLKSISIASISAGKSIAVYVSNAPYTAVPTGDSLTSLDNESLSYNFEGVYRYIAIKGTDTNTEVGAITIAYEAYNFAKDVISDNMVTNSTLRYSYSKNDEAYSFSKVAVRVGGLISASLWDSLNTQSNIQGYGVILSTADYLDTNTIKGLYDLALTIYEGDVDEAMDATCDQTNIKDFYTSLESKGQSHPDEANASQKGSLVGTYYIWNLYKHVMDSEEGLTESQIKQKLMKNYVAVAYIKTANDGIIFMDEIQVSAKSLAQGMIDADPDDDITASSYNGSLGYLAGLTA